MRPEDIIIAPVITEKSNDGMQEGKYTFEVNKKATKVDIANAVEKLFEVKVLKVAQVGKMGAFLDWGLEKDLFLPFREQTRKVIRDVITRIPRNFRD